jgi:type VI secretion system secreted protein VgrG
MSKTENIGKTYTLDVGDELVITVGKSKFVMKSDGTITLNGHTFSLGTTSDQNFNADGEIIQHGKKIFDN